MGICLRSAGFQMEMDMGYGSFMRLRTAIAVHLGVWNEGEGNPYSEDSIRAFIGKLNKALEGKRISRNTAVFLTSFDAGFRMMPGSCRGLLEDISDMPEQDDWYGYSWSKYGRISDFRQILRHCIREHRCLIWS